MEVEHQTENDYAHVNLEFPRSHNLPLCDATIKTYSTDFYVEEIMNPELSGSGEHVWLWLEKEDQNTEYVAKQLANFCGVRSMDIGFSGLKDRWALTRQWMSVYLGNRPEPNWSDHSIEGVTFLKIDRHSKKLRRGEHAANHFRIILRELSAIENVLPILEQISQKGFPNYYGAQRFGFDGANLSRAYLWFQGKIKASRSQRSFYLSATRSYLFNLNLASVLASEHSEDLPSHGPLYGDPSPDVLPLSDEEAGILSQHPVLAQGIHKNRMKLERRPYFIKPANMNWEQQGESLVVTFDLPAGVFATTLLHELGNMETVQGAGK